MNYIIGLFSAHFGEIISLATALVWAFAVIMFKKSGESVHPLVLNLFKNVFALILFVPTLMVWRQPFFHPAPVSDYALLILSGALGIGLADTMFFKSLNYLGAGLSAVVDCLYSPFVIILALIFLGEKLTPVQGAGAALIILAIIFVACTGSHKHLSGAELLKGIAWGVASMAVTASAIVIAKPLLDRSPVLWVTLTRLYGGVLILPFLLVLSADIRANARSVFVIHKWRYTIIGSFLGTYIAMLLWITGMKFTQASIASAINQTSNIFIFIFAAVLLKEPLTRQRVLSLLLAISGVFLITFGG
jgi:drug/metabolite transporter (DMT)-like permease